MEEGKEGQEIPNVERSSGGIDARVNACSLFELMCEFRTEGNDISYVYREYKDETDLVTAATNPLPSSSRNTFPHVAADVWNSLRRSHIGVRRISRIVCVRWRAGKLCQHGQ